MTGRRFIRRNFGTRPERTASALGALKSNQGARAAAIDS
jgi:hypothetical protein